ncbi:hypothetical protein ABZZ74_52165 [Streptomyces sp. NPDC006476]|uniref:hypothetical protein n=1 Tax=Streptomyces sp. NPDC006476 TaxID=3157175 RepID=UPI0033A1307F
MANRLGSGKQRSRRRSKGRVAIAIGGTAAAAGLALFGISQANAAGVDKEIKVLANTEHKSFDVVVQGKSPQCVNNPNPGSADPVDLGIKASPGDTVTVFAKLLDCSFSVPSRDTQDTVTVPDNDSLDVVLDVR